MPRAQEGMECRGEEQPAGQHCPESAPPAAGQGCVTQLSAVLSLFAFAY